MIELTWFSLTGGHTPAEVPQVNRSEMIDLCIKGWHSKDQSHVKKIIDASTFANNFSFDYMDVNNDGYDLHQALIILNNMLDGVNALSAGR